MPKRLLLHHSHVAGYVYANGSDMSIHTSLRFGHRVQLVREPRNPHDANAIALYVADNIKLGYLPRVGNAYFAFLLDLGIDLECIVMSVDASDECYTRINIAIVLGDEQL